MEIPRYWRTQRFRYGNAWGGLNGFINEIGEVSFDGRHWVPNGNGHCQDEKPLEQGIIYQAPKDTNSRTQTQPQAPDLDAPLSEKG